MEDCSRCYGTGIESYEDDFRMVEDTCYHCGGTGKVDSETAFHDKLGKVAAVLAQVKINQQIKACNSHPDGEGWDFCAAECGMSSYEYTQVCLWGEQDKYMLDLMDMSRADQELMIAWNEYSLNS